MSSLLDSNERPIQPEAAEKPANGKNHDQNVMDVRAVPTGTLLYTFVKTVMDETGVESFIHQMEAMKLQQRMVADPGELVRAKGVYHAMAQRRYVMARELNERFADLDKARRDALGIAEWVPPAQEEPAAAEEEPDPPTEEEMAEAEREILGD